MNSFATVIFALAVCAMASGTVITRRLKVVEDVTLERGSTNFNYLKYLIVGTHPRYPLKRSLVRFSPSRLPECSRIRSAYLYLYYAYAHKASFMSEQQVPSFARTIVAHRVLKSWSETQATSTRRFNGVNWAQPWLNLGSDAVRDPTSSGATITPGRDHRGYYFIDVTSAVQSWQYTANYGLLLRATNEYRQGRDFRFYSKSEQNSSRHPFILVTCDSNSSGGGRGGVLTPVGGGGGGRGGKVEVAV